MGRLAKFLCCIPLQIGVIMTGCLFGITDIIIGSIGLTMVVRNEYPDNVVEFFRTMDTRTCVASFTATFYTMALNDLMLIYGAVKRKPGYFGPWLIVNFMVLICTMITALLSSIAIIRIVILSYCLVAVNSFYDDLTQDGNQSFEIIS